MILKFTIFDDVDDDIKLSFYNCNECLLPSTMIDVKEAWLSLFFFAANPGIRTMKKFRTS